jgi:hypothetical protein
MHDAEFDSRVEDYLEGRLGVEEVEGLEQELQASALRRARFWELAEVHALARGAFRMASETDMTVPLREQGGGGWRGWGGWGIAASLLLGVLVGFGGAGAVWALAGSLGWVVEIREATMQEDRERVRTTGGRLPSGMLGSTGWAGDVAEWAGPEFSKATVRFVEAVGEGDLSSANSCDLYRIVDLRPLLPARTSDKAALEFSAEFLDNREAAGDVVRFTVRVQLYTGEPEDFVRRWPESRAEVVSSGSELIRSSGGEPGVWRRAVAHTFVPREATFALLQVVATRGAHGGPARFEEQYVRAISAKLRSASAP